MLTVSDDDADLSEAVESGALGYLLKNLNADQFFEMLDGLQRGEAAMTRQTTNPSDERARRPLPPAGRAGAKPD